MSEIPYCDRPAPAPQYPEMEQQVFELVNQKRLQRGRAALMLNNVLVAEARKQAQRAAESGKLTSADHDICGTLGQRLRKAGYKFRYASENLAQQKTAEGVVRAWENSQKGHKEHMLDSRVTQTGVGVFQVGELRITCQIYAQPKSSQDTDEDEVAEPIGY